MLIVPVKFLREVTPYFRKASIISEVGWELQRAFLSGCGSAATPAPTPRSPQRADTCYLPLQLAFLARNLRHVDPSGRTLELHSPDGVHSCALRAADAADAAAWFKALHRALGALTERATALANRVLAGSVGEVQLMGWLARWRPPPGASADSSPTGDAASPLAWQSVFAAVTDRELRLYESAPWSPEAWAAPAEACPLLATRLVSGSHSGEALFVVRVGTVDGVVTHRLRAQTQRDLAAWVRELVYGPHQAVRAQREVGVRCSWQGRPCQLALNLDNGFSLLEGGVVVWHAPFGRLRASADDAAHRLWLDFGEDTELELELEASPKPFVFILHNFLSAKIEELGLTA